MSGASRRQALIVGMCVGAGLGLSVLLLQYTFAMPTSDIRLHLRVLVSIAPWSVGGSLLGILALTAVAGVLLAGWRTRWAVAGAVVGAILSFAVLLSGIFGYLVWAHAEDIRPIGQWARAAAALVIALGVIGWARTASEG